MRTYDFRLVDWIGMAVNSETLAKALAAIRNDEPLECSLGKRASNSRYLEKIMREEVIKQFKDSERPMLEVILNAIDSKPKDHAADFDVYVKVKRNGFSCLDYGKGMTLEDVMTYLIIFYNTEKNGIDEIGQHGVGFLSTLKYCLNRPGKVRVKLYTAKDGESYDITAYSTSEDVSDLRMSIRRSKDKKRKGTLVDINNRIRYPENIIRSFGHDIQNIPPFVARIHLNRYVINEEDNVKWYTAPVTLKVLNEVRTQQVGIKANFREPHSDEIALYSQGVYVTHRSVGLPNMSAKISFPSGARIVEGRDEFKRDENYDLCVKAAFVALMNSVDDSRLGSDLSSVMSKFIPGMASFFGMDSLSKIPDYKKVVETLFPGKKYVLESYHYSQAIRFMGEAVKKSSFCSSAEGCAYWTQTFGDFQQMLKDLPVVQSYSPDELLAKAREDPQGFYPNLNYLIELIQHKIVNCDYPRGKSPYTSVQLVHLDEPGKSCLYAYPLSLFININHPRVKGEFSEFKGYSVLGDYFSEEIIYSPDFGHDLRYHDYAEGDIFKILDGISWSAPRQDVLRSAAKWAQHAISIQSSEPTISEQSVPDQDSAGENHAI